MSAVSGSFVSLNLCSSSQAGDGVTLSRREKLAGLQGIGKKTEKITRELRIQRVVEFSTLKPLKSSTDPSQPPSVIRPLGSAPQWMGRGKSRE